MRRPSRRPYQQAAATRLSCSRLAPAPLSHQPPFSALPTNPKPPKPSPNAPPVPPPYPAAVNSTMTPSLLSFAPPPQQPPPRPPSTAACRPSTGPTRRTSTGGAPRRRGRQRRGECRMAAARATATCAGGYCPYFFVCVFICCTALRQRWAFAVAGPATCWERGPASCTWRLLPHCCRNASPALLPACHPLPILLATAAGSAASFSTTRCWRGLSGTGGWSLTCTLCATSGQTPSERCGMQTSPWPGPSWCACALRACACSPV